MRRSRLFAGRYRHCHIVRGVSRLSLNFRVFSLLPSKFRRDDGSKRERMHLYRANPLKRYPPSTSPITLRYSSGGKGMIGIPLEAKDVSKEALLDLFPTPEVLGAWYRGEDAEWPPMDDLEDDEEEETQRPRLRFNVGDRVICRVGPDPVTGWAPGKVVMLWYREPSWPVNSWAPYKIELDDGRNIFAPGDVDQIIRAN